MENNQLAHHGIKGMRWGVRRFQNKNGGLTAAGKKRYITGHQAMQNANKAGDEAAKKSLSESRAKPDSRKLGSGRKALIEATKAKNNAFRESIAKDKAHNKQLREEKKANKTGLTDKQKTALKVGVVAAGTALAVYGATKLYKHKETIRRGQKAAGQVMSNFSTFTPATFTPETFSFDTFKPR